LSRILFEPELALLVGLQVVSSKEREGRGRKLFDKMEQSGILWGVTKVGQAGGGGLSLGGPSPGC